MQADLLRLIVDKLNDSSVPHMVAGSVASSFRQIDDVAQILASRTDLDHAYLDHWASELDVADLLTDLRLPRDLH